MHEIKVDIIPVEEKALGGGLEGAQSTSRETMTWQPSFLSPDQIINAVKPTADARTQDLVQNDGYASGVVSLHRDNIVGAYYVLNAKPNWRVLGADQGWAEEFQQVVEARFNTIAESEECWLDASRTNTFTGLVRLAVGSFVMTGEVLATAEWLNKDPRRPFSTAIQLISPARLNNPNGQMDTRTLRRGIEIDAYGRPTAYWIQSAYPTEWYDNQILQYKRIPAEKPWGRRQVIHLKDQLLVGQNRGISEMVAALKQMRMTKKFQEITLQNAVINATYAAAIESELPSAQVFEMLGAQTNSVTDGMNNYIGNYLSALNTYLQGAKNIAIDGAKLPHLFPGTKLNMQPMGTPGGVGTSFEQSLLRHIAACLGLSYEEFSRDYTQTNYSSARASMNNTWKSMQSKKRNIADRFATQNYALWLEEEIGAGNIPLPRGKKRDWFYEPLVKDALIVCDWIGASRGQIDEYKETQAAELRISSNLSTYEKECARLGQDFREVFAQRAREKKMMEELGIDAVPIQPNKQNNSANTQTDPNQSDQNTNDPASNK